MSRFSDTVINQFEQIQDGGVTNMVDQNNVKRLAQSRGFTELENVIESGSYIELLKEYNS